MQNIIIRIILVAIALFIIVNYVAPKLTTMFPPFGAIILILVFLGIVWWLLSGPESGPIVWFKRK